MRHSHLTSNCNYIRWLAVIQNMSDQHSTQIAPPFTKKLNVFAFFVVNNYRPIFRGNTYNLELIVSLSFPPLTNSDKNAVPAEASYHP